MSDSRPSPAHDTIVALAELGLTDLRAAAQARRAMAIAGTAVSLAGLRAAAQARRAAARAA